MPDERLKEHETQVMWRLAAWLRRHNFERIPPELYTLVHLGLSEAFILGWQHKAPGPWEDEITADWVRPPEVLPEGHPEG